MMTSNILTKLIAYTLSDKFTNTHHPITLMHVIKTLIPPKILTAAIREMKILLNIVNDVLQRLLRLSYVYQGTTLDITQNNPPLKGQLNYVIGVKISTELMIATSRKLMHPPH